MRFRLLGPLEVIDDQGHPVAIGGLKPRTLLAVLLLHANQPVATDELMDALWGDSAPPSARQALHFFIHRLRRSLTGRGLGGPGGSGLLTSGAGYCLEVLPDELDSERFERALARAAALPGSQRELASKVLEEALAEWRGAALAELHDSPVAAAAATRLEEMRVAAQTDRVWIELALGRHGPLVAELEALVAAHPLRERLRAALVLALYRSGRQAEALQVCRAARATMVEELGIEPGPELQRLERDILNQAPSLDLDLVAAPVSAPAPAQLPVPPPDPGEARAPEVRKVVTVLVTTLREPAEAPVDPEDARSAAERLRARVTGIVERYGGIAQSTVGGIILAVFGARTAHDDDPERAVRAALELSALRGEGGPEIRVGVETGQALITFAAGRVDVAGQVVDRAAALADTAAAGEVLAGPAVERCTRRVIAYTDDGRALDPRSRTGAATPATTSTPLLEREYELAMLTGLLGRARRERQPQLVTLVGGPGMGKSRLIYELGQLVEADAELVTWRQGRSLPYGEGMTYWALAEIVKAHAGILETDAAAEAEAKLARAAEDAVGDPEEVAWVTTALRPLVNAGEQSAVPGEAYAAWIRFIAALAADRPLVLVFEDIQWADDGLLAFIDELVDRAGLVPLLVMCAARPELLDRLPGWSGGKRNATTISLTPLSPLGTNRLLTSLLDRAVLPAPTRASLVSNAGGNPLFVEEYVRMLRDQGALTGVPAQLPVPQSVQQLITARLDTLDPADRALLGDAAVVGETGWVGALTAISGRDRDDVVAWLQRLDRRDLLRHNRLSAVAGEVEYAFRHVLVRDVAYDQLPRAARAERHQRAATWIAGIGEGRAEDRAELLAYHWRRALELVRAARRPDGELASRARDALRKAGDRALALGAFPRAAEFYASALDLWPEGEPEHGELLLELGRVRFLGESGGEDLLERASAELVAAGRPARAAEAEAYLTALAWQHGRQGDRAAHRDRALALVEGEGPSRSKANVLISVASDMAMAGRPDALEVARAGLEVSRTLGWTPTRPGRSGASG